MKKNIRVEKVKQFTKITILIAMAVSTTIKVSAQSSNNYMRIAKITVDSSQLEPYMAALKEQMQSALKFEKKGVLAYSAVYDKNNPAHITILETYASIDAYKSHIQSKHFEKYKTTVKNMVKSLELADVIPIILK
jgi:quinol monooxygenase YgiN